MTPPPDTGRRHPRRDTPATLRVHVQLLEAFPPVWRRLEVATDLGLDDLHNVLQAAFGWQDYHLYRFATGPEHDPGVAFACAVDLAEAFEGDEDLPTWDVRIDELLTEAGERLYYQYDYGDNWWLTLEVEDVDNRVPPGRAVLVEGADAGPPEDCGGVGGYRTIVAAADPAHPDHRQAIADVEAWWGHEVAPEEIGLVPFDLPAVAARVQALELSARPPVPHHVGRKLAALLLPARTTETVEQLRRLASAAGDAEVDIDEQTAKRMTRPLQVLFDTVGGDGVKLTAAGYLPPAVVSTIFDDLDLDQEWIGKGNREDLTIPVLELRETAQRLGLLRKYKGHLVLTPRGRTLAADPMALWWHLSGQLPIGGRDANQAGWQAGVLLLALMASGSTDRAEVTIAQLLNGLGWALEGGHPIDRRTVTGLVADDVRLLRRVGALEGGRRDTWPGRVTSDGTQLARAALADEHP